MIYKRRGTLRCLFFAFTNNIQILFAEGEAFWNTLKYDKALEYLDKVLSIDGKNVYAFTYKTVVLEEKGNKEEALKAFEKILEIDPNGEFVNRYSIPNGDEMRHRYLASLR